MDSVALSLGNERSPMVGLEMLQYMLLLCGCRKNLKTCGLRILNRFCGLIIFVSLLWAAVPFAWQLSQGHHLYADASWVTELVTFIGIHFVLANNADDVFNGMAPIFRELDKKAKQTVICRINAWALAAVASFMITIVAIPAWTRYDPAFFVELLNSELEAFYKNNVIFVLTVAGDAFIYGFCMVCFAFYSMVQFMLLLYARKVRGDFNKILQKILIGGSLRITTLSKMRHKYGLFNETQRNCNAKLGLVPFLWLSSLFITTVAGLTEVVLYSDSYNQSPSFYVLSLFSVIGLGFVLAMAYRTGSATENFEEARNLAIKIIQALIERPARFEHLAAERAALSMELLTQPTVAATAWGMFVVDKKLVLKFMGSVVPFAVMFITTAIQQKRSSMGGSAAAAAILFV